MNLKQKYIKCFSEEKKNELKEIGYRFLYEKGGVFYFEDNQNLTTNFSNNNILKNTKTSSWINI